MSERRLAHIRVTWDAHRLIQRWADEETGGNWSEMTRKLLAEASAVRLKKERR